MTTEEPGAHIEISGDQGARGGATGHIEISGNQPGYGGATGHIELRGGEVVISSPEIAAAAGVVGEVTLMASGEVRANGRRVSLRRAGTVIVLSDAVRYLLEVAEDPSRKAEVNLAVSLLVAILMNILGAGDD